MTIHTQSRLSRHRSGFTLIELLVVMSIIAVLAALSIVSITQVMKGQKNSVTETSLQKIDDGLSRHWTAVVDQSRRESIPPPILSLTDLNENKARVVFMKAKLVSEFPVNFAEATSPRVAGAQIAIPRKPSYGTALSGVNIGAVPPEMQSAVCLMLSLTQNRRGVEFNPDTAFGAQGIQQVQLPMTNGTNKSFNVFVDAYGSPIMFVRWPDPFPNLEAEYNMPPYAKLNSGGQVIDPVDPEGWLYRKPSSGDGAIPGLIGHPLTPPRNYYPFVISAGRDKNFNTPDDLVSFRLRQTGQKGN